MVDAPGSGLVYARYALVRGCVWFVTPEAGVARFTFAGLMTVANEGKPHSTGDAYIYHFYG